MKLKIFFMALVVGLFSINACKSKKATDKPIAGKEPKTILQERLAHENDSALTFYDWNEGYAKSQRINKILLVDIYTDWCGYCKVMDRETYANAAIIKQLNQHFVCVKFNPEIPRNDYVFDTTTIDQRMLSSFLMDRRSSGYPTTTFWVNPGKKERLEVVPGFKAPDNFSALLAGIANQRFGATENTD
jgi:thioredoxin-related protein